MPHDPNRQLQSRALQGMRAMTPLLPGIVPFGLIAGFTPVSFGFTWFDAWAGSLLMFAGASQLAAYQLMNESASLWVILLTVAAINLRYLLYSASIAPHLADASRPTRLLAGYGLTDQIMRFAIETTPPTTGICRSELPTTRVEPSSFGGSGKRARS